MADVDGRSGSTGDVRDITPGLEGTVTGGSVIVGRQEMAAELEEVVDLAMAGEEPLGVARRLEALHLAFSSSCRLVPACCSEVQREKETLVLPLLRRRGRNSGVRDRACG